MRVLYSFPHKIGADRICYTAWQQVRGLAAAGVDVLLFTGAVSRPLPASVQVETTLSRGRLRIPYKLLGRLRALALHDHIVAKRLPRLAGKIDVVHVWPCAALETIKAAKRLGIPTVLERPNAHTKFCYEVVAAEHRRIGIETPHGDYRPSDAVLSREEAEFHACDFLLCPSEFAARSFLDLGFQSKKILRHRYGFDEQEYYPGKELREPEQRFSALFVGVDAVRKGLHLAIEAWLSSPASKDGIFSIAGDLNDEFKRRFASELSHPSIAQLGHSRNVPSLMRYADVLLLPSIEEGFALVCAEALGSGCVPLASTACTEMCRDNENALVHAVGDLNTLRHHITQIYESPEVLARLRVGALRSRAALTWTEAGRTLQNAYDQAMRRCGSAELRVAAQTAVAASAY